MFLRAAFLLLLIAPVVAKAQRTVDSLRSHYIQEYPDRFSVWPVLKHRELSFTVRDREGDLKQVKYLPNNAFTMGVGAYLFEVVIEATFAIPLDEKQIELYGASSARDLQANILSKKFAADLYTQKYSGFYINDKNDVTPPGIPFQQRADITTRNFGLGGIYIVNNRKFSLRSAFNYADRQLSSRGSIIVGGSLNSFKLEGDSAITKSTYSDQIGEGGYFKELRVTTIGITPGYSYTYIRKKFFLNGTLAIGPAYHLIKYAEDGPVKKDGVFGAASIVRLGIGYNDDRIFGGIGFNVQSRGITFDNVRFSTTSSLFRMVIGYRFKEIGILKKRAVDYVPVGF